MATPEYIIVVATGDQARETDLCIKRIDALVDTDKILLSDVSENATDANFSIATKADIISGVVSLEHCVTSDVAEEARHSNLAISPIDVVGWTPYEFHCIDVVTGSKTCALDFEDGVVTAREVTVPAGWVANNSSAESITYNGARYVLQQRGVVTTEGAAVLVVDTHYLSANSNHDFAFTDGKLFWWDLTPSISATSIYFTVGTFVTSEEGVVSIESEQYHTGVYSSQSLFTGYIDIYFISDLTEAGVRVHADSADLTEQTSFYFDFVADTVTPEVAYPVQVECLVNDSQGTEDVPVSAYFYEIYDFSGFGGIKVSIEFGDLFGIDSVCGYLGNTSLFYWLETRTIYVDEYTDWKTDQRVTYVRRRGKNTYYFKEYRTKATYINYDHIPDQIALTESFENVDYSGFTFYRDSSLPLATRVSTPASPYAYHEINSINKTVVTSTTGEQLTFEGAVSVHTFDNRGAQRSGKNNGIMHTFVYDGVRSVYYNFVDVTDAVATVLDDIGIDLDNCSTFGLL